MDIFIQGIKHLIAAISGVTLLVFPQSSPPPNLPSPAPQAIYIVSDGSWQFSIDNSSWENALAPSDGQCPVSAIQASSLINENGTLPMSQTKPNWAGQKGYFRKTFNLNYTPSSVSVKTLFDDIGDIYINGKLAYSDHINPKRGIQTGSINPLLFIQGQNVINVIVQDITPPCQSAQLELKINPAQILEQQITSPSPTASNMITISGDYTYLGQGIHYNVSFPKTGGNIGGTFNGLCNGNVDGQYRVGDPGSIQGKASGDCSVAFLHQPLDITYSGNIWPNQGRLSIDWEGQTGPLGDNKGSFNLNFTPQP